MSRSAVSAAVSPAASPADSRELGLPEVGDQPAPRASRTTRRTRSRVEPPVALGSLTQPGSRSGALCRTCASPRVTSLTLTLTDGTPVEFTSCHACESRTWLTTEGELDRATVLERTRKIR